VCTSRKRWASTKVSSFAAKPGSLFIERFQPEYPDQAINYVLLGLGYFDDVDPDDTLPAPRQQIVDYWTRRQREIIAARSR
jgi:hypothetical protein